MSGVSNGGISPEITGWIGVGLALLGVAIAQWTGSSWWGAPVAAVGMVLMLVATFWMQKEIKRDI